MNYGEGIISKVYGWLWHPSNSNETLTEWALFLVLMLIVVFFWTITVNQITSA